MILDSRRIFLHLKLSYHHYCIKVLYRVTQYRISLFILIFDGSTIEIVHYSRSKSRKYFWILIHCVWKFNRIHFIYVPIMIFFLSWKPSENRSISIVSMKPIDIELFVKYLHETSYAWKRVKIYFNPPSFPLKLCEAAVLFAIFKFE